jgi:adenine-specific DNA-methyltransferase
MDRTQEYIDSTSLSYRKKLGQYFTPDDMVDIIMDKIEGYPCDRVLENSCGTGNFLKRVRDRYPEAHIDACDIDPGVLKVAKARVPDVNYKCQDFLTTIAQPTYDIIIGNPPYFEIKNFDKDKFGEVIAGRANIYTCFIKHSIDSLKVGGILAYVIPITMNSGQYFKKLRQYIVERCNIIHVETFGSTEFKDAAQPVQILILQKRPEGTKNNEKFIFRVEDKVLFVSQGKKRKLMGLFEGSKPLCELGYEVKTGPLVWNQHKSDLTWDTTQTVLIWAHNISDGEIKLYEESSAPKTGRTKNRFIKTLTEVIPLFTPAFTRRGKFQYINKQAAEQRGARVGSAIVLNRVVGTGDNVKLRAAVTPASTPWIAENHVNLILPKKGVAQKISNQEVFSRLTSPEMCEVIQLISCNTQLSKRDIENILPFREKNE